MLNVTNLQVGDGMADLTFQQVGNHTVVVAQRREGPVSVRTVS